MIITPNNLKSKHRLVAELVKFFMDYKNPAVFCVGNPKIVGDAFAPMVAKLLLTNYNIQLHIYGRPDFPITASNVLQFYDYIKTKHDGILVLDSTFSTPNTLNTLTFSSSSCIVNVLSNPISIGQASILAHINCYPLSHLTQLYLPQKEQIAHLVRFTSSSIYEAYMLASTYKKQHQFFS